MDSKVNYPEVPDGSFRKYMGELAAEIVANGNPRGDLLVEMQAAHSRRQSVAADMATGKSVRAIAARKAIATRIWCNVQSAKADQAALFDVAQAVSA